ncbi:unnamed protein product [Victoria cruziana]
MLSMVKSLVRPEAGDGSEHQVEMFRPSKRTNIFDDITNLSLNSNFARCKRYKSESDKPSENLGFLMSKGLIREKHDYSGDDEVASRASELHSQIYPGIKTKQINEVSITLNGSDDREPSKSTPTGHEDTQYIPQSFEGKKVVSSPNFLGEQVDVATHSQTSFGRDRNLLDSHNEHIHGFAESHGQPLSAASRPPAINKVTSATFSFPDVSKTSTGTTSDKIMSSIRETFVKGHEEIHAAAGGSCVESSDACAMKKTAEASGTVFDQSGFLEDIGCSSQVRSLWREVSGHDRLHTNKSDTAGNCSCSFCRKAAYMWSDLNYHDVRGRLSVLKKSVANFSSLLGGNFFNDLSSASHKQTYAFSSSPEPGKRNLEAHLIHQWRSLFVQTEKALSSEIMQLQSNLQKLKELREDCGKDLEIIQSEPL